MEKQSIYSPKRRVSVNDSLATDTPPRFKLPNDLIHGFSDPHRFVILDSTIAAWNTEHPDKADITLVLSNIARMAQLMNDTPGSAFLWRDIWYMSLRFMPMFQQLLSVPRYNLDEVNLEQGVVIREALRLTCIILLSMMNRKFCISPDGISMYRYRVMKLFINNPTDWFPFLNLRLWVLVIAGLVAEGKQRRTWHIREIVSTMAQLGLNSWNEVLLNVKGITWVGELMNDEANLLGSEIEEFTGINLL
jgi:hypothetical protein